MAKDNKKTPLLVTTQRKGVFFGYGTPGDAPTIRLVNCRLVVYWTSDARGFLGLAVNGPGNGSRIGPAVPAVTLRDVTSVAECSADAAKKFEEGPWA